ncbi:MAG: hypothetical protein JOZ78_14815 [Chroococcidiopsidaceae cyanobacterium CP_BM_ER_R8_30]|nr:hypothetical protein [Chroococcidiopsidaceae cyanobacterium CP_BM_ER_R8_30]
MGFTSGSIQRRLEQHRSGAGAKITRAAVKDYGVELKLARQWSKATRTLERQLKSNHNFRRICPICTCTPMPEQTIKYWNRGWFDSLPAVTANESEIPF